jgi:hypothetical protein
MTIPIQTSLQALISFFTPCLGGSPIAIIPTKHNPYGEKYGSVFSLSTALGVYG